MPILDDLLKNQSRPLKILTKPASKKELATPEPSKKTLKVNDIAEQSEVQS